MSSSLNVAKLIDHTLLRPDAAETEIIRLCEEARSYGFFSVCIHPLFINVAKDPLSGTDVRIATVAGFPLGMALSKVKVFEAEEAAHAGADEIDTVMNIGLAKSGRWLKVERELSEIVSAVPDVLHKIIIEACYLTDDEKRDACAAVGNAGADFVKTSTGFGPSGATVEDVRLIRSATGGRVGIKAAGGIKTLEDVFAFIEAGAARIGTSAGAAIMKELKKLDNPDDKTI